jgi:uncharacterized protein (DUF342 family)
MMTATPDTPRQIPGDLLADHGPVTADQDVLVAGSIRDGVEITTPRSVRVAGAVEAARIRANQLVVVKGGIIGKQSGSIFGGTGVHAKFCHGAAIVSDGDIDIDVECVLSDLCARGAIRLPQGALCGGRTVANGGVHCRVLGNSAGTATEVGAGFNRLFDESASAEFQHLSAVLEQSRSVRAKVEPIMKCQKSLLPAQREKAIELLYNASEAEEQARRTIAQIRNSLAEVDRLSVPEIVVHGVVHANVTIRFRGVQLVTHSEMKGPLRFTLRRTPAPAAICVTDITQGKTFSLATHPHDDPTVDIRAALGNLE